MRSENVEFLVAPYEADAQLAYLSSLGEEEGGIVAVISEDSDLLAYGCPAVRTLTNPCCSADGSFDSFLAGCSVFLHFNLIYPCADHI